MYPALIQGDPHTEWPQVPVSLKHCLRRKPDQEKLWLIPSATGRAGTLWPLEITAQEHSQKASVAHQAVDKTLLRMSIGAQFSPGRREQCWQERRMTMAAFSIFTCVIPVELEQQQSLRVQGCSGVKSVAQGRNSVSFLFLIFFCSFTDHVFRWEPVADAIPPFAFGSC